MAEQLANLASTTLSADMNAVSDPVTFNVADGSAFPNAGNFRIRIDDELLLGTARTGNQITANRAVESTTIAAHTAGATVACRLTKGALQAFLDDHATAADPHTVYQLGAERGATSGYASLDASGDVPDAQIASTIARTADITTHAGAADPHTGYQRESEKSAASGYASLGANSLVPAAELGTGAGPTKYLRGDQTWQTPAGSTSIMQAVFTFPGTLFTTNGTHRWYADRAYSLVAVISSVGTAPTGDWVRLRINKNGADTLFSPNSQRPTIAAGTNVEIKTSGGGLPFAIAAGNYLTLDVVVIGSTEPGADLTCQIVLEAT